MTGPEPLSVRAVCERIGTLLGPPRVGADRLIEWVADSVARGDRALGKPTRFESRDGTV